MSDKKDGIYHPAFPESPFDKRCSSIPVDTLFHLYVRGWATAREVNLQAISTGSDF